MRECPKCGKKFPDDRIWCNAWPRHNIKTVEIIDWTDEDEAAAMKDLEEGLAEDPFDEEDEDEEGEEEDEDLREDLVGQADLIHDLIEESGPLTYAEIGEKLGVSPKRASNIVSTMIRDGVKLKREGSPRKVSLA